jgi:hypothetical protein
MHFAVVRINARCQRTTRSADRAPGEWINQTRGSTAVSELYLSISVLGADQLHEVNWLALKESAVVDVTRRTIKEIEEIFLQGFTTSARLG